MTLNSWDTSNLPILSLGFLHLCSWNEVDEIVTCRITSQHGVGMLVMGNSGQNWGPHKSVGPHSINNK